MELARGQQGTPEKETASVNVLLTPPQVNMANAYEPLFNVGSEPVILDKSKWVADIERSNCRACNAPFTQTNRRHHCRLTGEVICDGCSLSEQVDGEFVRVSVNAFRMFMQHFPATNPYKPRIIFGKEIGKTAVPDQEQLKRVILRDDVSAFDKHIASRQTPWHVEAKLTSDGRRALHIAAQEGCANIFVHLTDNLGANEAARDNLGRTPLHLAAMHQDVEIAAALLEMGASLNEPNAAGVTPLHVAAQYSLPVLNEFIGRIDRSLSAATNLGAQAVHFGAQCISRKADALEVLINAGCDFDAKDTVGRSPLHYAAAADNVEGIQLLHSKVPFVEGKCHEGRTPLLEAAAHNRFKTTKLLLELGADLLATDRSGCNFMDLASSSGGLPILAALEALAIERPTALQLLPERSFLPYAIPLDNRHVAALAGDPRVPATGKRYVQRITLVNDADESVMFQANYVATANQTPPRPGLSGATDGSIFSISPPQGFLAPKSTVEIKVELRLPMSRLYKEFEKDKILVRAVKCKGIDCVNPAWKKIWARIDSSLQFRVSLDVKVRVYAADSEANGGTTYVSV